jgi:hypothetical protein
VRTEWPPLEVGGVPDGSSTAQEVVCVSKALTCRSFRASFACNAIQLRLLMKADAPKIGNLQR